MSRRIRQALRRRAERELRRLPPWPGGPKVAVVYPNTYRVGMANLGLHAVLEQLAGRALEVDRFFLPDRELMQEHLRSGTPPLGLERAQPLGQYDLLLVSLSFEPDMVGLVQLLRLAGLEPLASRRPAGAPVVAAGGLVPTLNPAPLEPLCDLIAVGEAEALLPPLLEALEQGAAGRAALVPYAATLPGWYAPQLQSASPGAERPRCQRQHAALAHPCYPTVLAPEAAFAGHLDVELSRGCRWRCRFCAAGHVVTPYRELDVDALEPALAWAFEHQRRVGLVGTDVSDHSRLEPIARRVWDAGGELALPSLRVERLAQADSAAARLVAHRPPRSVTMAVEAASGRLRRALDKRLEHDAILRAAENLGGWGVQRLKVYLLAAIPGERWEEIERVADLAHDLLRVGPPGRLALSVTGMVPKPGTPMQWDPAPDRAYLRRVRAHLRRALPRDRVELNFESPDWTRWQALLSLAGAEAAELLLLAADQGWRRALARAAAESPLLQGQGRAADDPLPWDHLDRGPARDALARRRKQVEQE